MEKKTSIVDWLVKEISEILGKIQITPMQDLLLVDAIKQAKEMNQKQMEDIWDYARNVGIEEGQYPDEESRETFLQYYSETYGSTKQN